MDTNLIQDGSEASPRSTDHFDTMRVAVYVQSSTAALHYSRILARLRFGSMAVTSAAVVGSIGLESLDASQSSSLLFLGVAIVWFIYHFEKAYGQHWDMAVKHAGDMESLHGSRGANFEFDREYTKEQRVENRLFLPKRMTFVMAVAAVIAVVQQCSEAPNDLLPSPNTATSNAVIELQQTKPSLGSDVSISLEEAAGDAVLEGPIGLSDSSENSSVEEAGEPLIELP